MHSFFQNRLRFGLVLAGASLLFVSGILLSFGLREWGSGTLLLLHFDRLHGADLFGFPRDALGIWLVGIAIFFLNLILSFRIFRRIPVASLVLIGFNVLFSFFLLAYIGLLLRIN